MLKFRREVILCKKSNLCIDANPFVQRLSEARYVALALV
jgi:hypothetical protein